MGCPPAARAAPAFGDQWQKQRSCPYFSATNDLSIHMEKTYFLISIHVFDICLCELISSVAHSKLQERSSALEVAALLPQWLHGEIPPHLKWALTRKGHKGAQLTYLKGGISECKWNWHGQLFKRAGCQRIKATLTESSSEVLRDQWTQGARSCWCPLRRSTHRHSVLEWDESCWAAA